jgi:hypothetical protein
MRGASDFDVRTVTLEIVTSLRYLLPMTVRIVTVITTMQSAVLSFSHESFCIALIVKLVVVQQSVSEHLRSRTVSRRFSVQRQLFRGGTLDGVILISNSFLVQCSAESALMVAGSLLKPRRVDLHRLWMQRFSDKLPRIAHSALVTGRAIITFRTRPGPSLLWAGREMQPPNIVRHNEGQQAFQQSSGSACFGAMSLPIEEMASVGAAVAGCDLTPPRDMLIVTPSPSAMARLLRLHAAAGFWPKTLPPSLPIPRQRVASNKR